MAAPRKYPIELIERAVNEVLTSGRPIAHVAADLGIHREALRKQPPSRCRFRGQAQRPRR
jgi:transposase-like protein